MMERNRNSPDNPDNPLNPINPTGAKVAVRPLKCEEWEALLTDAIDGALTATDSAAFYTHSESCKACATTLEETRKGHEWLQFLHDEPAVPGDLLVRILARTSGTTNGISRETTSGIAGGITRPAGAMVAGDGMPVPLHFAPLPPLWKRASVRNSVRGFVPALVRRAGEPRLMMTAAMAFFSIALTMNLMGIRVSSVHLADLKPGVLQTNIRRSYITANARVSRYYDNLRIVYEVESRMHEMQRTSEEDQSAPSTHNDKKPDGSAGKTPAPGGKSQSPRNSGSRAYQPGRMDLAAFDSGVESSKEKSWA